MEFPDNRREADDSYRTRWSRQVGCPPASTAPLHPERKDDAQMRPFLIVFLGAGLGGAARHGVNIMAMRLLGTALPYGTMLVNVAGSIAMGLLTGWFVAKADPGQHWRLFLTTGLLGGFTTFSTFSLDLMLLYERDQYGFAALYACVSITAALAGLYGGLLVTRHLI
jgi:CrcB protein